jgi:hypothetical protein
MIARIDLVVDLRNPAILVDQKADSAGVTRLGVGTGTVGQSNAAIGVAQQWKWKIIPLCKRGILFNVVEADAQDLDIVLFEVADLIAEPATLDRSARCVGLGIKPENHLSAAQSH